jgi:ABC-type nickel/cobalt efflux system permease component RcnA
VKTSVKWIAVVLTLALVVLGTFGGSSVPFAKQWPLYEALRATAAIIFAVVGAWLAIAYPERLRISLRKGPSPSKEKAIESSGVIGLMAPIVHSTAILGTVLIVGIIAPLIRELGFVREHVEVFRGLSYGLVTALTLWQLWTVVLTLIPADTLRTNVAHEISKQHTLDLLLHRTTGRSVDEDD